MKTLKRMQFEDLKKAQLGQAFGWQEMKNCCKSIYGAVSWPGRRPGFVVVVAMDSAMRFDNHDICLLEESESFYMRDLVRSCGALDLKYSPDRWVGDYKNDAAFKFITEMNSEHERHGQKLRLTPTQLLDMEQLYPYILDEIRRLLSKGCRQLFLKDSKILNYLSEIEEGETASLELGDFPAVEALAFAVIEMRSHFGKNPWAETRTENNVTDENYDYKKHGFR